MQTLIANKELRYDRKTIKKDAEFTAKESDAKILILSKVARDAQKVVKKTITNAPVNRAMQSETPKRRGRPPGSKNTYKTKKAG